MLASEAVTIELSSLRINAGENINKFSIICIGAIAAVMVSLNGSRTIMFHAVDPPEAAIDNVFPTTFSAHSVYGIASTVLELAFAICEPP